MRGNLSTLKKINVNQAGKVFFGNAKLKYGDCNVSDLSIFVNAANTRVIFSTNTTATGANLVGGAANVRVELPDKVTGINFIEDKGGQLIRVNDKNQEAGTLPGKKKGGIQDAVAKLNILTGAIGTEDVAASTTVTSGAITGTGLNVTKVKAAIKASVAAEIADLYCETPDTIATNINVDYSLKTTNILTMTRNGDKEDVISVKTNLTDADKEKSDVIRAIITYDGYSVTKEVTVKLQ